jgi:hypothetical protein
MSARAGVTLILGLIIAAVGVVGVAPVGPAIGPAISEPIIQFGAGLWVLGIIVMLLAPVAHVMGSD